MLVLERILAIPELDPDKVQMGLSTHNRGLLRARGYKRTDGTEAKDRFIKLDKKLEAREKAVIKGDKKLSGKSVYRDLDKAIAAKAKKAIAGVKGGKVVKKKIQNIYDVARGLTEQYGVPLEQVKKDQWVVTKDGKLTRAKVIKVRSDGSIKINPNLSDSLPTNPKEKVAVLTDEKDFLAAKAVLDKAKPKPKKQRSGVSVYIDKPSRYESEVTDLFAKHPYVKKLYETSNSSGTYLSQRKPKSGNFTVVTRSDFKKMLDRETSDSMIYDDGRGSNRSNRMSNRI